MRLRRVDTETGTTYFLIALFAIRSGASWSLSTLPDAPLFCKLRGFLTTRKWFSDPSCARFPNGDRARSTIDGRRPSNAHVRHSGRADARLPGGFVRHDCGSLCRGLLPLSQSHAG